MTGEKVLDWLFTAFAGLFVLLCVVVLVGTQGCGASPPAPPSLDAAIDEPCVFEVAGPDGTWLTLTMGDQPCASGIPTERPTSWTVAVRPEDELKRVTLQ